MMETPERIDRKRKIRRIGRRLQHKPGENILFKLTVFPMIDSNGMLLPKPWVPLNRLIWRRPMLQRSCAAAYRPI